MEIIQEVGSYAGFAAVVGLAVLSALYFSQARDVRRLREWAGRAPERAAEQAAALGARPEETAQQAARPAASGAVRPIPAAKPAQPSAAGAKPATAAPAGGGQPPSKPGEQKPAQAPSPAAPVPATAAANAGQAGPKSGQPPAPAGAQASGEQAGPKEAEKGADAPSPDQEKTPDTDRDGPAAKPAPPVRPPATRPAGTARPPGQPARPGAAARAPAAAAAQSTAVLPPSARVRRDAPPERRRLDGRYIALIVAGVIVVGGAAAFGVSQLGEEGTPETPDRDDPAARQAPINPSTVTVSVLNGTTVPGLAAQIGDEVESVGFQRGNVANALDQQRTSSVVLFAEGADREARLVARRLGISDVEPIDPDSQALAGNASVVVIVGADQTQ